MCMPAADANDAVSAVGNGWMGKGPGLPPGPEWKGSGMKRVRKTSERVLQELVGYAHSHGMDDITVRVTCRNGRYMVELSAVGVAPPADLAELQDAACSRKRPEIEGYYQALPAADAVQRLRRIGAMADAASVAQVEGRLVIRVEGPGQPD